MITLSSDFGSPYPAAMKGAVLARTDARLVDVAHDFPRQDVRTAAFWLREVLPTFPPAVHLVVVDPGVGTDREALAIRADEHALVGPDNGVLVPAARTLGDGAFAPFAIRGVDPASTTFHGRDVFAPAAATVHEVGVDALDDVAGFEPGEDVRFDPGSEDAWFEPVEDVVALAFPDATVDDAGATGEVLVVDGFGNAITNVPGEAIEPHLGERVTVDGESVPAASTYAGEPEGRRLVTVGSHGNVELAVNRGRGVAAFGVEVGDVVRLEW